MMHPEDAASIVINGDCLSAQDAAFLASDQCDLEALLDCADRIRDTFCGNRVYRCAIQNARSGRCSEDCAFCAQSGHHNANPDEYPLLEPERMIQAARDAMDEGVDCFGFVTSGRRLNGEEIDTIVEVLKTCRELGMDRLGGSFGILGKDDLLKLKNAGLKHYNHNLETSRAFYPQICTTHTWDQRKQTVCAAIDAGLEVCSGGIFGLGEQWSDRIELAIELRELGVPNVPLNFLSPIPGTPLDKRSPISDEEGLRIIAIFRFLLPTSTLRICGGRPVAFDSRGDEIFRAGGSGILTGNYLTTSGITYQNDRDLIERIGMRYS